jgi:two-component system sensor histidine kinase DegS
MLGRAERKGLPPDSPFRAELAEVRQITQDTLEKMRGLSQMLHPTVLDDYGLAKALDWYAQLFQKQTGIATRLDIEGDIQRITGQAAIHCFRIVQEALNNAVKHGKTKSAEIRLNFGKDHLTIGIRDFGVGFSHPKRHQPVGLGLVAMKERAELMRGEVTVSNAAGGGTLVMLRIPLPQEEGQAYLTQGKREAQVATHDR